MPHSVNNSTSTQTKVSRPSSTSTQSNAFLKQAGDSLLSPDAAGDAPISPSPSQFSFASSPREMHHEQLANDGPRNQHPATMTRGTTDDSLGELRPFTSRSRAQYYEDSFNYKDNFASSARERVTKDAPIVAELRTNVIVCLQYLCCSTIRGCLTKHRSRMNTPWLQISRTTSPRDTKGPKRLS